MSGETQPRAQHIEPFERAKALFLEKLSSEQERMIYKTARPDNIFYQADVAHKRYTEASKLQACRTKLMPLITAIEGYGDALDTLSSISTVSTFMAPIWGGLRVVIHVAQEIDEYFENLINMLRQIGETLPQYHDYHRLFPDHGRLMLVLSEALASILIFCKKVKDHFDDDKTSLSRRILGHRGSWKKIGLSVPDYLDDFEKAKRLIEQEAGISKMIEDKEHHHRHEEEWALQLSQKREDRLKKALSTLSKINYKNQLRQRLSEHQDGTGKWLVQEFESWISDPTPGCFYLLGIPGSGKSVLASTIIDHSSRQISSSEDFLWFHFCDYKDPSSLKCSTILGNFICQALDLRPRPEMLVDWVIQRVGEGEPEPTVEELTDALKKVMDSRKRAILVFDGIDELERAEQIKLRGVIQGFLSLGGCAAKIFVSCGEGVIELSSVSYPSVKMTITPERVRDDIYHYIEKQVASKRDSGELDLGNNSLEQEIVQALSAGANELFLWAALQIEELCECLNDEQIWETLNDLPKGLADTYARILQRIARSMGGPKKLEVAHAAFRWITCAVRPLQMEELFEALAINETDTRLNQNQVKNKKKFIQACGNLVTIQLDGTIRYAHHTVQQFLLRDDERAETSHNQLVSTNAGWVKSSDLRGIEHVRFYFEEGDRQLGRLCVTYLNFEDFEYGLTVREKDQIQISNRIVGSIGSGSKTLSVARKAISRFHGYNAPSSKGGRTTLPVPKIFNKEQDKSLNKSYRLLEYVRSSWHFHLDNLILDDDRERVANIALVREFPFETRPWRTNEYIKSLPSLSGGAKSQRFREARLIFYWALENNVRMLHEVLKQEEALESDMESELVLDLRKVRPKETVRRYLFHTIAGFELYQDKKSQGPFQLAAKWGPDQLLRLLQIFSDIFSTMVVPIRMFYQGYAAASDETRQFLEELFLNRAFSNSANRKSEGDVWLGSVLQHSDFRVGFDEWTMEGEWLDTSNDKDRIMSEVFALSVPNEPDLTVHLFSTFDRNMKDRAVLWTIQRVQSAIEGADDDTKRNFVIEYLVAILYPTFQNQLLSIQIGGDMWRWQEKWNQEVISQPELPYGPSISIFAD
ncbi:hypothetical protein HDK77DRAFT_493648 [Phyllosticta capitalensis]